MPVITFPSMKISCVQYISHYDTSYKVDSKVTTKKFSMAEQFGMTTGSPFPILTSLIQVRYGRLQY